MTVHRRVVIGHQATSLCAELAAPRHDPMLTITATGREQAVGASVTFSTSGFRILAVAIPHAGVASWAMDSTGAEDDLPGELMGLVDALTSAARVTDSPVTPQDAGDRLNLTDACAITAQLRDGTDRMLAAAVEEAGLSHAPGWLRDMADGAQASLTACLIEPGSSGSDPGGCEAVLALLATQSGWGELSVSDDDLLGFRPLRLTQVADRVAECCELLAARGLGQVA